MSMLPLNAFEQGLTRYLTPDQLARIRAVTVGVAGAGGLGSNCCQMLVRCGFVRFVVVDFDVVEASNLNRQFYFAHQIGKPKVEALRENLLAINANVRMDGHPQRVDDENVATLFAGCDVVVEAFDSPQCKRLLVETCLGRGTFLVAASGLAGWGDSDRIVTRSIRDDFHVVGDMHSVSGPACPPMAPCVTIAAAKQADLILAHVLGSISGSDSGSDSGSGPGNLPGVDPGETGGNS